jgi:hypothetical protein
MKTSVCSRRPIVVAGCVLLILSACGAEGEGSIHLGRTPTSNVMLIPDRQAQRPEQPKARSSRPIKARSSRTTPKARLPR